MHYYSLILKNGRMIMHNTTCNHPTRTWRTIDSEVLNQSAALFAAVADPNRLRLLLLLQDGEVCVTQIAEHENANIKTVSARLKKLLDAGLVQRRQDAKHRYYSLADEHVIAILYNAIDHVQHPIIGDRK